METPPLKTPALARLFDAVSGAVEVLVAAFKGIAAALRELAAGLQRVDTARPAATFQSRKFRRQLPVFMGYNPSPYSLRIMKYTRPTPRRLP